jgi:hypothetical protein
MVQLLNYHGSKICKLWSNRIHYSGTDQGKFIMSLMTKQGRQSLEDIIDQVQMYLSLSWLFLKPAIMCPQHIYRQLSHSCRILSHHRNWHVMALDLTANLMEYNAKWWIIAMLRELVFRRLDNAYVMMAGLELIVMSK